MDKLTLDIGGTKIVGALFQNGNMAKSLKVDIGEYHLDMVILKIQNMIDALRTPDTGYIGISLNGQINNGYVYYSRVLGGKIESHLVDYLDIPANIEFRVDNDVNCMCRGVCHLKKDIPEYLVLLNIGTGLRTSYYYQGDILKGSRGFFGELRDTLDVLDLGKAININDLVCGRGITNIYHILTGKTLSAEDIYTLSKSEDPEAIKSVKIFIKYFINVLCRISYTYNPQDIVIDGSVKIIINEHMDEILLGYSAECEEHFLAKIEISTYENTALYGALNID